MNPTLDTFAGLTRRHFFKTGASGIGGAALASMFGESLRAAAPPTFAPQATRIIYLFQSGGPAQRASFPD